MIACDGGCDDWFHGKCVGVRQEDEELVDRYICPNCSERTGSVTTWKPMCRRGGCNRPARLKKGGESKYCSDACGEEFWRKQLEGVEKGTRGRGRKRAASEMEEEEDPLGGPISAGHVKALVQSVESASAFRRLGSPEALTPPASRPGTSNGAQDLKAKLTEHEKTRLAEIAARKDKLRDARVALKEREDFVRLTRERAQRAKERNGGKPVCGYDNRLAWDEVTFREWLGSLAGQGAKERNTLSPPPDAADDEEGKICERKTCGRHQGWAKLAIQDVRFDEECVREEMQGVVGEEAEIRRVAAGRKEGEEGEVHGWVEVVKDE